MDSDRFKIVKHEDGDLIRLQTREIVAMDVAVELLGFLNAELDAEIENSGWKHGYGLQVASPILIQLESLKLEFSTDGSEILFRRVGGSRYEFEELCELIISQGHHEPPAA